MPSNSVARRSLRSGLLVVAASTLAASAGAAAPAVVKYAPHMDVSALAGRADTDLVSLPNGRQISVRAVRQLDALARAARTASPHGVAPVFLVKPAATGIPVRDASDLSAALKHADNETIELPSGRLATVGQIKFVQPLVEKQLGRPLSTLAQRPALTGPAIKVGPTTPRAEWESILKNHPDNEVLETPDGHRLTVAELKQGLAQRYSTGRKALGRPLAPAPAAKGRPR
jgi:hypothetical protein